MHPSPWGNFHRARNIAACHMAHTGFAGTFWFWRNVFATNELTRPMSAGSVSDIAENSLRARCKAKIHPYLWAAASRSATLCSQFSRASLIPWLLPGLPHETPHFIARAGPVSGWDPISPREHGGLSDSEAGNTSARRLVFWQKAVGAAGRKR